MKFEIYRKRDIIHTKSRGNTASAKKETTKMSTKSVGENADKKKEAGEKKISPYNPLIRKGTEEIKSCCSCSSSCSSARAGGVRFLAVNVHEVPTLEFLLEWAEQKGKYPDTEWIKAWYKDMVEEKYWTNDEFGLCIRNWPAYFRGAYLNAHEKTRTSDTPRIDVRRHAANWRGTRKEDLDDVLG